MIFWADSNGALVLPALAATEFMKISTATAIGFAVMGFIGFFVRLIHIPVNSILLGALKGLVFSRQALSYVQTMLLTGIPPVQHETG